MNKSVSTRPRRSATKESRAKKPHLRFDQGTSPASKPSGKEVFSVNKLVKNYTKSQVSVEVLKGVSFSVNRGEFAAIVGQSGSGKSTLLHLMGTLDSPDSGEIYFEQERIDNLGPRRRDQLRNHRFGMIFQFYHLLPELTTLENVLAPKMIQHSFFSYWSNRKRYVERAKHLLEVVGLSHRLTHKPNELSGGEMQRTAIARALIAEPAVLLADEPTGNLDQENGQEIMRVLRRLNREEQVTTLFVTHDQQLADNADRIIHLKDGRVV